MALSMRIQIAHNSRIYGRAVLAGRTMSLLVLSTRAKISPLLGLWYGEVIETRL